jgi:predicted RNase H-like HicB family nuclease
MSPDQQTFAATVRREDGSYWAELPDLPGCFASGETISELREAIEESAALYLADRRGPLPAVHVALHEPVSHPR